MRPRHDRNRPTPRQLARCRSRVRNRWPVLGWLVRRSAIRTLARYASSARVVPLLVEAAQSDDRRIARQARRRLELLEGLDAVDALCEEAIRAPSGLAAELCVARGLRPSDEERECVFLFVTRQLDAYFEADFEFQSLRLEYERADAELKRAILRVLRSGDRRCLPFFTTRKPIAECSPKEIRFALRSFLKHRDWPRLFQAFLELPLRYGLHILHDLRRSGWEPEDPEQRAIFRQVMADSGGALAPSGASERPSSAVFDRWLEVGRSDAFADRSIDDLVSELGAASPSRGVSLVAAIARRSSPGSEAAAAVAVHPHWLVRLAGHVTGLVVDFERDTVADSVEWVPELAPQYPLLELAPARVTPALLEALGDAPASTLEGPLGVARRVLRTLMGHRITCGSFEDLIVEVDTFAGEFEFVAEDDLPAVRMAGTEE